MWKIAYNIILHILLPFFLLFALTREKIRNNLAERLWSSTKNADLKGAIWIHAASIGEAVIAETIVNYMRNKSGFDNFLITTNTYYARDMLRKKFNDKISVYSLPFDLPYSLEHFIGTSNFKLLVIVETEIWPNLIWQAKKRNIPVIIINGRISDKTYNTYLFLSLFLKTVFSDITLVLTQSEEHTRRFNALGMASTKVINTGNIKYYRDIPMISDNIHKENIITFGSIREKEVEIIIQVIDMLKKQFPLFRFFIVPRELNLVGMIENRLANHLNAMRYSVYKQSSIEAVQAVEAVVVDTVGDLLDVYKKSMVAFVGGSLAPYGGQNILEPLFFSAPVLFGPHIDNFRDIAGTILESNAGIMVNNAEGLFEKISLLIENDGLRERMGEQGRSIIEAQKEVMGRAVNIILETIAEK